MSKVDIKRLDSVTKNDTTATEQINDNFQALQAAIENTVSRDGTVPNYMDADLDLNSYRIINAGAPVEGKDVVTLEYFEEKAGGAIEAAAEAKASASKAASSAQSALIASNNAIGQLAQAEGLLTAAEGQLAETRQYVDAAKADINATVEAGKQEINTTIDDAQMSLSDTINQAVDDVKTEAVAAAEGAIQDAANTATQIATNQVNDYTMNTVVPQLNTLVENAEADASNAAESAEIASTKATEAKASADDSEHYANDSRIWAEGTDSEVQAIDGTHSSKVWAEMSETSADRAETNASEAALHNLKNKITNCITEIPQDIKLELNNGTLTLKAGSKLYVPNGAGKFDEVVVGTDKTLPISIEGTFILAVDTNQIFQYVNTSNQFSGTSWTPKTYSFWYDTNANLVKLFTADTSTPKCSVSLPIAVITTASGGSVKSIDQVFNGFGYIGSTVFALPGVKGLIPNGRNADGSLKNVEFTVSKVITQAMVGTRNVYPIINSNGNWDGYYSTYLEQETQPTSPANYTLWYDTANNVIKDYVSNVWAVRTKICPILSHVTSDKIDEFNPKLPFRAVDQNDFNKLDEEAVKTSGAQTIAGTKTFTNAPKIVNTSGKNIHLLLSDTTANSEIGLMQATSNGKNQFMIYFANGNKYPFVISQDPSDNTKFSFSITSAPAATSNTAEIATTAWVNTRVNPTGNNNSWKITYSNGFKIMGGIVTSSTTGGDGENYTVTYPAAFTSRPTLLVKYLATRGIGYEQVRSDNDKTGFLCYVKSASDRYTENQRGISWVAYGI